LLLPLLNWQLNLRREPTGSAAPRIQGTPVATA
jgi:hypothetical protein